ncbi:hypothetical protein [Melghirimyces algeriensis]|uniref:Uncharacterized protein n=1 Tax=Melghirimyces algeriensis TaxID=910412 RepID=A0A521AK47_9BACL|nr:hypothetical protein [Melghirimyces algeriensis]SMO35173.1 hypothetical protein SAMN06264849_101192 [Melghirimyces algeriensis]
MTQPPKIDTAEMDKISRQLEDQVRKQVYDTINEFLKEEVPTGQPDANRSQPKQKEAENMDNMFYSLSNFVSNAVRFSMSTLNQQKKSLLRKAQQQMQMQMNPSNQSPNNEK